MAFHGQVTQKHPYRGQDHPDGIASVVSIAFRNEGPQITSRIRSRIVSQAVDKMRYIVAIGCEGRVDDSPLSAHPVDELANQGTGLGWRFGLHDPSFAQVTQEDANT
jgi:hypothetical protein